MYRMYAALAQGTAISVGVAGKQLGLLRAFSRLLKHLV